MEVEQIVVDVERLAELHARLTHREMELEAARPVAKLEAIRRVMEGENPDTGKPHSFSSAEKAVETDAEYGTFLKTLRDVVLEKNLAWGKLEAACLRARLGIALVGGAA